MPPIKIKETINPIHLEINHQQWTLIINAQKIKIILIENGLSKKKNIIEITISLNPKNLKIKINLYFHISYFATACLLREWRTICSRLLKNSTYFIYIQVLIIFF